MLGDAVSRWAACGGLPTGQTCELLWSDLLVLVGLFLVADAALSWFLRWDRALQDLPMGVSTPIRPADSQPVTSYSKYWDDDGIETSDHHTAA